MKNIYLNNNRIKIHDVAKINNKQKRYKRLN